MLDSNIKYRYHYLYLPFIFIIKDQYNIILLVDGQDRTNSINTSYSLTLFRNSSKYDLILFKKILEITTQKRKREMQHVVNAFIEALLTIDTLSANQIMDEQTKQNPQVSFIEDVVVTSLERIGNGWQEGTYALSQVYMAGKMCEDMVNKILPPGHPKRKSQPRMSICVLSDHHKLGKTIVFSLLRASGFDLFDYGTVEVDTLISRIQDDKLEILLISVLMLPSALKVKTLTEQLSKKKLDVKILVGGAPFRMDNTLWQEVGADAMCGTASDVLKYICTFMEGR